MEFRIFLSICLITICMNASEYKSQFGQDRFLNEIFFKNKKRGVFIDIGAHDGLTYSNSWFFEYVLEWQGICFEPIPSVYTELCKNRKCLCINKCVSDKEGMILFREVVGSSQMLSGIENCYHPTHMARIERENAQNGGVSKLAQIPSCKLNSILEQNNIYYIDLLSIDVEGGEFEILRSIDYDTFYFRIICVENPYSQHHIRNFLASKGFEYVTTLDVDDVFINNN